MSLSHFDEKSGIVACGTPWGKWWQTINEIFIDVDVPKGTRGKDCQVLIQTGHIECKVNNEVIFEGGLFQNVIVDDCTWTLEEQRKISILLTKVQKFTTDNLWESLLIDEYAPDPLTREEMLKKLDLEKFQIENGSGEETYKKDEPVEDNENDDASSVNSDSDAEEENDQGSNRSSPAHSPAASEDEDEVHISEAENSNQGSDNEAVKRDEDDESSASENEASDTEADKNQKPASSDQEDNVPEINIQSEDEKEASDDEAEVSKEDVDEEAEPSQEVEHDSDEEKNDSDNSGDEGPRDGHHSEDEEHKPEDSDDEGPARQDQGNDETANEGQENQKEDLIANIFGDSDSESDSENKKSSITRRKRTEGALISDSDGEVEKTEDVDEQENVPEEVPEEPIEVELDVPSTSAGKKPHAVSDDDSDDELDKGRGDFISDFDLMMQRKKENSRKRKRKDVDIINDSDDLIADIIAQMRIAADEDRALNKNRKTATKKLKILPMVMSQLKKQDLKMAFLDQGVLNVIADWLAPLPDRSLPNLQIREGMIKRLLEFPSIDQSLLKASGVGRALMYLFRHPKETKKNKESAGRLITSWARPIFNVTTDYHSLTKEEREQRDYDHIPRKRKMNSTESPEKKDIDKALSGNDKQIKPGEKGWVGRARVPMPSNKDYVHRPQWNVETEFSRSSFKKPLNRFEKHMKTIQEKKKLTKSQRAVTISIEGRKMAI